MKAALLIAGLWLAGPAQAASVEPGAAVAGHPGTTYLDLMRQVVADLDTATTAETAKARRIVAYRHIEGPDAKTTPAGPVWISGLESLSIHAGGKPRLALLADLGPSDGDVAELALLALFDIGDRPKLLDVVEVGRDRLTGFAGKPLAIGHGTDLIVVDSDHFNSDQDYVGTELIFLRNDRFALLDAIFTFDDKGCGFTRTQQPAFATHADPGRPYDQVLVTVRETVAVQADAADCSGETRPRALVRTFRATYRWDVRRQAFATASGELKQLARENEKRF